MRQPTMGRLDAATPVRRAINVQLTKVPRGDAWAHLRIRGPLPVTGERCREILTIKRPGAARLRSTWSPNV
jgi:hypothetical protein